MSELNTLQMLIEKRAKAKLLEDIKQKISYSNSFIGNSHVFTFEIYPESITPAQPGGVKSTSTVRITGSTIVEVLSKQIEAREFKNYIERETKEHLAEVESLKKQVAQLTGKLEEVTGLLNI